MMLNLENTHLGDRCTIELCSLLIDHPRLMEINLARNNISNLSCKAIGKMIMETYYLVSLNLHWNTIRGEGAILILDAICQGSNLKVLDLSWNTIGMPKSMAFAQKLSETFQTQDSLVHFDLSNNRLNADMCKIIAKGLADNHSLWGLHMIGNEAKIDSKGFMVVGTADYSVSRGHLTQRIRGGKMVFSPRKDDEQKGKDLDNCWICEGWNEIKFTWPSSHSGKHEPVYLHLESDNYRMKLSKY